MQYSEIEFLSDNHAKYLDKGYVKLIEVAGDDALIDKFARASFTEDMEVRSDKDIQGLLNYLVEHKHTSPIEAGELYFQIKMPIFVQRQHVRHRTASLNEQSLRYAQHDGDFYLPAQDRFLSNDKWNKQGSGEALPLGVQMASQEIVARQCKSQWEDYNRMLDAGVTKEIARGVLGTFFYTTICWKMDTKNMLHYLMLRDEGHAQLEIQWLAQRIAFYVQREFPKLYAAYEEYMRYSVYFSRTEIDLLRAYFDMVSMSDPILGQDEIIQDFQMLCRVMSGSPDRIKGSKRRFKSFLGKIGVDYEPK